VLSDSEINALIGAEEANALDYNDSEITLKRTKLLDYYNTQLFGDEQEGQSQIVTSDVADVVNWMIPSLLRIFTQGKHIATFSADRPEYDDEAEQKQEYANHVFLRQNQGVLILHNMIQDALLQYTGVVKVYWDEVEEVTPERYKNLSELELKKLELDPEIDIVELEEETYTVMDQSVTVYDVRCNRRKETGKIRIDNIPPEEFLICRSARDFENPRFIGHRTPVTRSDLIEMGFDKDDVDSLASDQSAVELSELKSARYHDYGLTQENPSTDKANDVIYLGEYYAHLDIDGDGIAELWQIFRAGNKILRKEQVDVHPFAVIVPVPIPHRAIGSCPAEQAADIQYIKSTLVRQMFNNIYNTNYQRVLVNERVDLDDLLTPRTGGAIRIDGEGPIGDSAIPLVIPSMVGEIMQGIEYVDTMRETRTGVTRYNQGLDAESLNKTATGFKGMMDAGQQRIELVARIFAETGIKRIFEHIVMLASKYQDDTLQLRVTGKAMEIDPSAWKYKTQCRIDVGLGAGDRQEKIVNLNQILMIQKELLATGNSLSDSEKMYNTLNKLVVETGLKDATQYFNDPAQPEQQLQAENEQLKALLQQMQMQLQQANPLAEVEQIRAQSRMQEAQLKAQTETQKTMMEMQQKQAEMMQKIDQFNREMYFNLTKLEADSNKNIPGALI
jgi:hypothetical protein